jgi:antitoxin YefM
MNIVTFSELRTNLKQIMDNSLDQHEPVVIRRQSGEHMVLMAMRDYESLNETAYLLGTEANAIHLRKSLASARAGKSTRRKLVE